MKNSDKTKNCCILLTTNGSEFIVIEFDCYLKPIEIQRHFQMLLDDYFKIYYFQEYCYLYDFNYGSILNYISQFIQLGKYHGNSDIDINSFKNLTFEKFN